MIGLTLATVTAAGSHPQVDADKVAASLAAGLRRLVVDLEHEHGVTLLVNGRQVTR